MLVLAFAPLLSLLLLCACLSLSLKGTPRGPQDRGLDLPAHAGGDSHPHAVVWVGGGRVVERLQGLAGGAVPELGGGCGGGGSRRRGTGVIPRMTDCVWRLLDHV